MAARRVPFLFLAVFLLLLATSSTRAIHTVRLRPSLLDKHNDDALLTAQQGDGREGNREEDERNWVFVVYAPVALEQLAWLETAHTTCFIDTYVNSSHLTIVEFHCARSVWKSDLLASLPSKKGADDDDDDYRHYPALQEQSILLEENRIHNHHAVQVGASWGLDRIDQRGGALNSEYSYTHSGSGVDVYVIDTGIRTTHQEFGGRATFLHNAVGDGIDTDCHGHGTHVSAIIGGDRYGVAKSVHLFGGKALNCNGFGSTGTIASVIAAIIEHHEASNHRPAVINLSLGGGADSILDALVNDMVLTYNMAVSVAAGNSGDNACFYSPARASRVLTVGASTREDRRASFSNRGECVNLFAPGNRIVSAWATDDTATNVISGTSMSTPFVSGVCALVYEQDPSLSASTVMQLVVRQATPDTIPNAGHTNAVAPYTHQNGLLYSLFDIHSNPPPILPHPPISDAARQFLTSCVLYILLLITTVNVL